MADHVLVAYDGSPQSDAALDHVATELADADRVTLLYVVDPAAAGYTADLSFPSIAREWYENAHEEAETVLAEASDRLGVAATVETVVEVGRPAPTIAEYAADHDVDRVVTGSHGRTGVSRVVLGSVAESVVRLSPVPVTVVR